MVWNIAVNNCPPFAAGFLVQNAHGHSGRLLINNSTICLFSLLHMQLIEALYLLYITLVDPFIFLHVLRLQLKAWNTPGKHSVSGLQPYSWFIETGSPLWLMLALNSMFLCLFFEILMIQTYTTMPTLPASSPSFLSSSSPPSSLSSCQISLIAFNWNRRPSFVFKVYLYSCFNL